MSYESGELEHSEAACSGARYQETTEEQRAFDACHDVYRSCAVQCFKYGRISAVDPAAFKPARWRPDRKPRAEDFVADFARAGNAALEAQGLHSRVVLFRLYYLGGAPYNAARSFLQISPMGWTRWTEEIRSTVGGELMRRRIYPAADYFRRPG